jgi:cytoskeletal protein CcmA (bactofilin family)
MFSSKKDTVAASAAQAAASVQPAKRAASSSAPSIIGSDLVVSGTLVSTGDIQIDGRVEGDVRSARLVIGDTAFIHGEVSAEEVTIRGRIEGGIRARKVLLCATSHVEGNILHEAFAVETGAFFEGNCRHAENPLAEDVGAKKPAVAPVPSMAAAPQTPTAPSVQRPVATDASRPLAS